MAAYCIATGRKPADFFKYNTFVNQSDDNMWGTSDESLNPTDLVQIYDQFFGGELEIESQDDLEKLMFLGKMIEPGGAHAADYELVGRPVPEWAVKADVSNLLMRRSAFTTRVAGFKTEQHMRARIQRTVGHGLLCAHNRQLFTLMAKEWMDDARVYLLRDKGEDLFDVVVNSDGHIMSAKIKGEIKPRSRADQTRLNFLAKMGRLLDYVEVLESELSEVETEKLAARHTKILKLGGRTAVGEYARLYLGLVREVIQTGTPSWVLSLDSEPDIDSGLVPFYTPDYRAELFIYLSLAQEVENPADITMSLLLARAKEAPYRYVLDIPGFMYYKSTTEGKAKLLAISFGEAQNYVVAMTLFYVGFNAGIESLAKHYDWANAALEAYNVVTLDMPRVYSVANTAFWHLKGRSSAGISSLQPRDPYLAVKQASRMAAFLMRHLVPSATVPRRYQDQLASLLDRAGRFLAFGPAKKLTIDVTKSVSRLGEWMAVADVFLDSLTTNEPYHVLQSPTGTGKSREFVAALVRQVTPRFKRRTWLVVPRNIIRDNYSNGDVPADEIIKIDRESVLGNQTLVVSTYGAFMARLPGLSSDGWVLVLDEFHEGTPEQVAVEFKTRDFYRIFVSATPKLKMFPSLTKVLVSPVQPRFKVTYVPIHADMMGLFNELNRLHPEAAERCLMIVPTISEANKLIQQLLHVGHPTSILSRYQPVPAREGIIAATQVADAGITIMPAPEAVISSRDAIVSDRGETRRMVISASTLAQRAGRAGRTGNGFCYHHPEAGTGPEPEPYPVWGLYQETAALSAHFDTIHKFTTRVQRSDGDHLRVTTNADPTQIMAEAIEREPPDLQTEVLNSLRVYYLILTFVQNHLEAMRVYSQVVSEGLYDESIGPVEGEIKRLIMRVQPLIMDSLRSRLDARPFITKLNGRDWRHCGIKLFVHDVVLIGTPSNPMR